MTVMSVPLVDLRAQQLEVNEAISADLHGVLKTADFVDGPDVEAFESEYAAYLGARHCVGVANGTDALELALRAVGVGAGHEVVLPANSFIATAEAVVRAGASPVLVDVDPATLLMDPERLPEALSSRTRAVVPVHLFGQVAPMETLARVLDGSGIQLVEDAAQAQGASRGGRMAGTLSSAAATSFYPGKNLGAAGDAGAVTTDDPDLAERVRKLGHHGGTSKYVHEVVGFNSRLDSIQAVVLRHKLRRLEAWNDRRREAAAFYSEQLGQQDGVRLPVVDPDGSPVWHLYTVRVPRRDAVLHQLQSCGIGVGIHYPVPIHLTPAFGWLGHSRGDFPVAEQAAEHLLSLPIYPHITRAQQEHVVESLQTALAMSRRGD